jgi:hypothetical protein
MQLSRFGIAALLIFTVAALVSAVSAIPVLLPHAFNGDVVVNGAPAPDGTTISATVSEGTLAAGPQNPVTTVGGSFGRGDAPPLLVQGEIPDGATITFHVNGVPTGTTAVFETGGGPTAVHLSVVTDATPPPARTPARVSSGGGSGDTPAPTEVPEETVTPEVTEPGEGSVMRETPASSAATTPVTTGTSPVPVQAATRTPDPEQAPLVYAPVALIAGGILFIAWTRRH